MAKYVLVHSPNERLSSLTRACIFDSMDDAYDEMLVRYLSALSDPYKGGTGTNKYISHDNAHIEKPDGAIETWQIIKAS